MEDNLDIYESKQNDLHEKITKTNETVRTLQASKDKIARKIEKIEVENHKLQETNQILHQKIIKTQRNLSDLKQSPESKCLRIRRSLTMMTPIIIEPKHSSSEDEDEGEEKEFDELEEKICNDPNIEQFLKQLKELKILCKEQNDLLVKYQETTENSKEDNERLQKLLAEIEKDKKGISEIFGSVEARQRQLFASFGSPDESPESSMFISTLDGVDIGHKPLRSKHEELKLRPALPFVKRGLLSSHVSGLKL